MMVRAKKRDLMMVWLYLVAIAVASTMPWPADWIQATVCGWAIGVKSRGIIG